MDTKNNIAIALSLIFAAICCHYLDHNIGVVDGNNLTTGLLLSGTTVLRAQSANNLIALLLILASILCRYLDAGLGIASSSLSAELLASGTIVLRIGGKSVSQLAQGL